MKGEKFLKKQRNLKKIMEIKLYAPITGKISKISELNDGVFSEKMLGDGFFIEPENNNENILYSIFDSGSIEQIFDTKHALFLKANNGPIVLMHIGLDTVNLEGKPFKLFVKEKEKIVLDSKIIEVDWELIENNNLIKSIPIVLDENENTGWKFSEIKTGKVKKGEEIATLEFKKELRSSNAFSLDEALKEGISLKEKYQLISEKVYQAVGTSQNYNKYYNCITRLRFDIKDKSQINEEEILKIKGVKGVNWNGNELQLIFGGEVTKVRDAFDRLILMGPGENNFNLKNNSQNAKGMPFFARTLAMFKGIVLPCLPAFLGVALITALKAILEISGAISVVGTSSDFSQFTLFEVFLFNLTFTCQTFITIFIAYSATKYFGGNTIYGLICALILCAPLVYRGTFKDGVINPWTFSLWETKSFVDPSSPIPVVWLKFGALNTSLISGIFIGYVVSKVSSFFTKIIPASLSMVVLPPLIIVVTVVSMFFVIGPLIGMLETFLGQLVGLLIKIPYGIDRLIFGFLWPMLVITGAHVSLIMIIQLPWLLDPGNIYINIDIMTCIFCSALGQLGVGIGLLFKTKNNQLKQNIYAAIPASVFGISEPMMYGVNIPSGKAFLFGCTSTAIGSMVIGLTGDAHFWKQGGNGILSIINVLGPNGDVKSLLLCMLGWVVTLGVGITLSLLFCNSRVHEKTEISKIDKKVLSLLKVKSISNDKKVRELISQLEANYSKENIKFILELEKLYEKSEKFKTKIESLEGKENSLKIKLSNKFNKNRETKDKEYLENLLNKINKIDFTDKLNKLESQKELIDNQILQKEGFYKKIVNDSIHLENEIVEELVKLSNKNELKKLENNYFNAINSLNISLKFAEKKDQLLTNKEFRHILK